METKKISLKGFALACGVLWAGAVLVVAFCNWIWPGYGSAFLNLIASVYPGYHGPQGGFSILVGAGYALVDGAVGGLIFAALYNIFSGCCSCKKKES